MLKEVRNCLRLLYETSKNIEDDSVNKKLIIIQNQLTTIETEVRKQSKSTMFFTGYTVSLAVISMGLAIKLAFPQQGFVLMTTGLSVLILMGLYGIGYGIYQKLQRTKTDE